MTNTLMNLPYAKDALSPYLSQETILYHYDQHHANYVKNLNNLIIPSMQSLSAIEIMKMSYNKLDMISIFNNAAQVVNHDFYWLSMQPNSDGMIYNNDLLNEIEKSFQSLKLFKEEFIKIGLSQFGSGWIWLVQNNDTGKLLIIKTSNADNPILHNYTPLITCDVWEHAYYIDFRHKRQTYLETFVNNLINWNFASNNLLR